MDEQEKEETDAEETEGSTDIQGYLASFNKEIQSGNNQGDAQDTDKQGDNCYVTHVTDSGELQEYQYGADSEGVFTTTYYATADGSLYAANPHQGNINQQIAFHTLAPSNSQDQGAGSDRGLQQLVLAVNDSNCLAFSDNKAISVVIPTSISSQLEQVNGQKEISARPGNSTKNHQPKFITAKPKCLKQEIEESKVSDTEEMECEEVADDSNSKPQTVMVIQESDIEGQQMIPVSNSGQTIVSGIGEELHIDEQRTLQMMANLAEQAAASKVSVNSENATLLSDGNSYQTVTIVPSDTNPGELSYVLFVSQADDPSEKSEDNVDLSIYDFNDGERHAESFLAIDDGTEDSKMHTIRVTPRRSQIVIQQHMCRYCNYTSPKRYLLSRHMKSHSDERPHKCNVCGRGFKTLASLQNHVNTHTGIRPHACKDCDSCFTTSGELVRHVRYKHTHEKPHRCSECDYASVELSKLKRHMRCHTGERPYQCPHCTYASPDTYKLKRHLRIHTGEKPYECDICLSRFTQSNSLKAHKLIHSGNKPVFHCQYCPATCGRKTDLRIHVQKLHSCDRPHRCKRCGKVFADRYSFKLHSKSHEGEKCYKCDLCSYASISRRHLDTHMLVHTDQKPYRCVECGQCFRQKQLLKRHKNLYHDPNYVPPVPKEKINECSECDKAFRHKGNLLRHLAVHDPDASSAERAEAMRIGQPKGPGELEDGEEDDYMDDDDELEKGKDSQQVVVFEVIQLPSANGSNTEGQTLTTADGQTVSLSGSNSQGFTIIQQAPDEGDIADQSQDSLLSDSEGENILKDQLVAGNVSRVSYEAPRRRGRPRKYPLLTEVQPDYSNQSLVSIDHNDTTSMDKRTHHLRKKKFGDADYIDDIYISNSPARRGRPPKNPYRSPKIVQIVAEKKPPVELNDSLPTIITIQDGELIVRSEKTLVEKCIQQKPKDMEECFGFDNNEDDSMLTISATSDYQAFHNTVEDDDAT